MPDDPPDGLSIRGVMNVPKAGRCILAGFPGLVTSVDGSAYIDPEVMEAALAFLHDSGASLCLAMPEAGELPDGALPLLTAGLAARGIALRHLPIPDFMPPGPAFMAGWQEAGATAHALLDSGGTLALTCLYGAGRSGMVAALLLIERGMAPGDAVAHVRTAFHEAVESEVQMDWLLSLGRSTAP